MFTWSVDLSKFNITKSKQDEKFIKKVDLDKSEKMLCLQFRYLSMGVQFIIITQKDKSLCFLLNLTVR